MSYWDIKEKGKQIGRTVTEEDRKAIKKRLAEHDQDAWRQAWQKYAELKGEGRVFFKKPNGMEAGIPFKNGNFDLAIEKGEKRGWIVIKVKIGDKELKR